MCDGFGVARFIHSLTELARGKREPSVLPVWERARLARKIDNEPARVPGGAGARASLLATSPFMPSSDLVCFNIFSFFRLYRIRIICSYEKVKKSIIPKRFKLSAIFENKTYKLYLIIKFVFDVSRE